MLHEQRALIESLLEEKKKIVVNPGKSQAIDVDDPNTNMSSIQSNADALYPSYIFNSPSPLTYDTTVQMAPSPVITDNNQVRGWTLPGRRGVTTKVICPGR